ncbi:MAG TPA: hypothetical protein VFR12_07305 [Pyrinomonadaceae bacterium]|nr:hypothetical protein [Pyrinomonadaceae bacterium]
MEERNLSIADYATGTLFPVRNVCADVLCNTDHGRSVLELRWYYSEPITIFARAGIDPATEEAEQDFVVGRDLMLEALRSGTGTGFPVVGEGNVMCQVLKDNRAVIAIGFNEGYIVLADRNALTEWLMGTYVHVSPAREEQVLDLDRVIAQLLYK